MFSIKKTTTSGGYTDTKQGDPGGRPASYMRREVALLILLERYITAGCVYIELRIRSRAYRSAGVAAWPLAIILYVNSGKTIGVN